MPANIDWIDHDGQGAPDLPPGTRVQVRFRDGCDPWMEHEGVSGLPFDRVKRYTLWAWDTGTTNPESDIVAYRVVQDEQ